ncbi:MAG: ATP-binding cassette domain-containing protein [Egibacteraceae bacterium]
MLKPTHRATPTDAAHKVLEVAGLGRRFGSRAVLEGLDAELLPGDRVALTGSNGSGKTTLIRCISGNLTPSEGRISVCGHDAGSVAARRRLGISLSQERSFYLRLSGRQNLVFFARLRLDGTAARRAVESVVEELELEQIASERVDRCSTGMVQQLALGRALLGDPELLVLDEPTRSLDEGATDRLWGALERRPAAAVLIATHRPDDIARCSGRLQLGADPQC